MVDKNGNLYGTTIAGGTGCDCGVIYKLAAQRNGKWKYTVLHRFIGSDGAQPAANLILDDKGICTEPQPLAAPVVTAWRSRSRRRSLQELSQFESPHSSQRRVLKQGNGPAELGSARPELSTHVVHGWDFKVGVARKPRRFRNLPGRLFSPYTEVCTHLIRLL